MKKATALIMSIVLFLLAMGTPSLAANALEPVSASELRASVESMGIYMDDKSIVQEIPIESASGEHGRGIVVTNTENSRVTKDVLILVDEDGISDYTDAILKNEGDTCSPQAGTTVEFPPLSWDGRYVIRGTAVYEQYTHDWISSYYRPLGAYFTYKKYQSCSVSSITMKYITDGFVYTYPNFTSVGNNEVENVIPVSKSNPAESTMYSKDQPYTSGRVIYTGSGSPMVGQFLTFFATVDGKQDSYTVKL